MKKKRIIVALIMAAAALASAACASIKPVQYGPNLMFDGVVLAGSPDALEQAFEQKGYSRFGMGSPDFIGRYAHQAVVLHIERAFAARQTGVNITVRRELSELEPGLSWEVRQLERQLRKDYGEPERSVGEDGTEVYVYPVPEGQNVTFSVTKAPQDCGDWTIHMSSR